MFKDSKQKKNTARVYFSRKYSLNCITFEQSYGLLDIGPIGIGNWRNFGTALAEALDQYVKIINEGKESALG